MKPSSQKLSPATQKGLSFLKYFLHRRFTAANKTLL